MIRKLILTAAAALACAACPLAGEECAPSAFTYLTMEDLADGGEETMTKPVEAADLLGRKFVLAAVDGEAFAPAAGGQPFIEFGEGLVVTGSACNSFRGPGELKEGVLTVANAATTRKMCLDPKLAEFEGYFHALLRKGAAVVLDGGALILTGGGRRLEYVAGL